MQDSVESPLIENEAKGSTTRLSASVVIERFSIDTAKPIAGAVSHLVTLEIPGRRGLYTLMWSTTAARSDEAEASADRAIDWLAEPRFVTEFR